MGWLRELVTHYSIARGPRPSLVLEGSELRPGSPKRRRRDGGTPAVGAGDPHSGDLFCASPHSNSERSNCASNATPAWYDTVPPSNPET